MHANFIIPGGLIKDIPLGLLIDIRTFCLLFIDRINELEELLSNNNIWRIRLLNIGEIDYITSKKNGFTGVMLRSTGFSWDL
jgi:NADH dehydrogenase (ubiquinone) Fe-S protein 2